MGRELLTLQDISKYYTSGSSVVMGLNRVNLTFRAGEFVAVTGESGSGKSTLAKILAGILPYESGELFLAGSPTSHYDGSDWERYRRDSISFISQSYDILPGCSVERNVVSALRLTGMDKAEAAVRAREILQEVELWEMRSRRAAKLSSGQKQRLSIARALAKPAPILIADEPTGNLDSENSEKVIELLSAAAKDRLVIIITHEFSEVADHATRHITMQDSVVSADVPLRERAQPKTDAPIRKTTAPKGLSLYTALLQVTSRPVWTGIMLTFFALTAFAVFAFLGTFIVNLDDTSTRVYDNSAFRNGARDRIIVIRSDGKNLTEDDIEKLLTVSHVDTLERYGLVSDVNYFYRDGVDYFLHYLPVGGTPILDATHVVTEPTLENYSLFVHTVPARSEDTDFLTAGRLPEHMYEIVAGDESLLGQTITVYIQDTKNWGKTAYLGLEMTVVGTTDRGSHLFFHEQFGRSFTTHLLHGSAFVIPDPEDADSDLMHCSETASKTLQNFVDKINESIENGLNMTGMYFESYGSLNKWLSFLGPEGFHLRCFGSDTDDLILQLSDIPHAQKVLYSIIVSMSSYEKLVEHGYGAQMCLYVDDYAYTDEVIEELRALGYGAVSPYRLSSNRINETKAAERMQTLKVCLLALIAVVALQIVVLRAMFSMEMEEYRLLANLGLRCKNARRSVLWQVIGFSLGGETLAVLAIALCGSMKIERIVSILRYLPAPYMLLTWAVHFGACLLSTAWIAHALRRQVYPVTGARSDLMMDEEVEA